MDWGGILQSGLSAVAIVLAAWATVRGNTKAKKTELETMTPDAVRKRLDVVEGRVGVLQNEQWADRDYMRRMLSVWPPHVVLPQPMPYWLAEHYGQPVQHPPTPGSMIERKRPNPGGPTNGS